jgi:hypothetical protein
MDLLGKAKPEHWFYCADGSVLTTMQELERKLLTIDGHSHGHHVNQEKNDFSNWIRDVFGDHQLALEVRQAKTPAEAAATIKKHMAEAEKAKKEIEDAIKKSIHEAIAIRTKVEAGITAKTKPSLKKTRASKAAIKKVKVKPKKSSKKIVPKAKKKKAAAASKKKVNWLKWLGLTPGP